MRAMEVIVQRLAKKLGVTNVEKEVGKLTGVSKAVEAKCRRDSCFPDRSAHTTTMYRYVKQALAERHHASPSRPTPASRRMTFTGQSEIFRR